MLCCPYRYYFRPHMLTNNMPLTDFVYKLTWRYRVNIACHSLCIDKHFSLKLQNSSGGVASYERTRSYAWMEVQILSASNNFLKGKLKTWLKFQQFVSIIADVKSSWKFWREHYRLPVYGMHFIDNPMPKIIHKALSETSKERNWRIYSQGSQLHWEHTTTRWLVVCFYRSFFPQAVL